MKYNPGEVYYSTFPKLEQIPGTQDFNIDSQKPEPVPPRPIAVLQQLDADRVIAVPIASDGAQSHLLYGTYVPLRHQDYPEMMRKGYDSYVKTNQVQPVEISTFYPKNSPKKITDLKPVDLERIQIFSLYASQTDKAYAQWIGEIVAKNVRVKAPIVEDRVLNELSLPKRPVRTPKIAYERGDISTAYFQPEVGNKASKRLTGQHSAIIMTNAENAHIPQGQTYGVPLLKNSKGNLDYFSSQDVLFGENRACVSQLQPINRDWIGQKIAKLNTAQMIEVDRGVISSLGLQQQVVNKARSIIQTQNQRSRGRG